MGPPPSGAASRELRRVASSQSLKSNKEAGRREAALEAASWVAAVTSTNVPTFGRTADQAERALHGWLRSGELLCEVANRVVPGSVRRIAQSTMPFKQMENISHYVEACTALGVPAQDLFMTVDLFEAKDMRAVVRNIHSLGRVAQTIDAFRGPHLGAKLAAKNERHFSEAQLAEARAMPARWTNLGKSLPPTAANSPGRSPSG